MTYFGVSYGINGGTPTLGYLALPENMPTNWMTGFYIYLKTEKKADYVSIFHMDVQVNSNDTGDKTLRYRTSETSKLDTYTSIQDEFEEALGNTKYYPKSSSTDAILRAWFSFTGKSKISF